MKRRSRGIILVVVLVVIGLLSLLMASYLFFVRAEMAGMVAQADTRQAQLAAESALEEVIAILRVEPHNFAAWYDNPDRFRHALVFSEAFDRESDPMRDFGSRLEYFDDEPVRPETWRFTIPAARLDGPEDTIRFGLTPESSKLNINTATEQQIRRLLTPLLAELGIESPPVLVNALLDWRDTDDEPREEGAESEYYTALEPGPAYNAKNGPLDTVEELLLVKGFSAALLYGEDVNRNGILDQNEDDGDESAPYYDNADGVLNHGIAPFLTVYTREPDTALDNRQRINLNANAGLISATITEYFEEDEISGATIAFLNNLKQQGFDFSSLGSVAELYAGPETEEADEEEPNAAPQQNPALAASPITVEEMRYIMDYFSVRPAQAATQPIAGLININTAPVRVLELIPGMTVEMIGAILEGRTTVEAEQLATTAWPLTAGVLSAGSFKRIAPYITTKSYQFHVEVLGYADHRKLFKRLEWVLEMVGPLGQVKYHRDLTRLGLAWPIDDENYVIVSQ